MRKLEIKIRQLEIKIRQIIWAFKKSFKPTSYDIIIYKGKQYYIKSSLIGENIWDLYENDKIDPTHRYIKCEEFKVIQSVKRFINVFKNYLIFQKQYWESIDLMNPIGKRLSFKNSDDIYFNKKFL